jgi:hypothetical protein
MKQKPFSLQEGLIICVALIFILAWSGYEAEQNEIQTAAALREAKAQAYANAQEAKSKRDHEEALTRVNAKAEYMTSFDQIKLAHQE